MPDLECFQFDIYQRYRVLAKALDAAFQEPASPVRLLDLGSGPGQLTRAFATGDYNIVASDVQDFDQPGIVKLVPGGPLPFTDRSFEAVVSMDVLEHVPGAQRRQFVSEAARVSSELVVLGFPHAEPDVREAERLLDRGYMHVWNKHCEFLTEHSEFGLPRHHEAAETLERAGFTVLTFGVCRLDEWLLYSYLDILFLSIFGAGTEKDELNRRFNESTSVARLPQGHYRAMVIGARSRDTVDRVEAAIFQPGAEKSRDALHLAWRAFESAAALVTGFRKQAFQEVYSVVAHDLAQITAQVGQRALLEASVAELTTSSTQARDTALALERRNVELSENFAAVSRALAEEQQRREALGKDIDALVEKNAQLSRELEASVAQVARLSEERNQAAARADSIAAERDAMAARVERAVRVGTALSREVDEARDRLAELESRHENERSRLERTESTLAEQRVALGKLTARLRCERRARLQDIERIEKLSRRTGS